MGRRWAFRAALVLLLVLAAPSIVGVATNAVRSTQSWLANAPQREFQAKVGRQRRQAPRPLASRQGDRERYPRADFGIVLESGDGFSFDTRAGVLTWDDRYSPDTTIQHSLPPDSLDVLYELALADRLVEVAERVSAGKGSDSSDEYDPRITFTTGAHGGTIRLRDLAPRYPTVGWFPRDFETPERYFESDEYKRIKRFQDRLDRMIVNAPGYREIRRPWRKKGYPM